MFVYARKYFYPRWVFCGTGDGLLIPGPRYIWVLVDTKLTHSADLRIPHSPSCGHILNEVQQSCVWHQKLQVSGHVCACARRRHMCPIKVYRVTLEQALPGREDVCSWLSINSRGCRLKISSMHLWRGRVESFRLVKEGGTKKVHFFFFFFIVQFVSQLMWSVEVLLLAVDQRGGVGLSNISDQKEGLCLKLVWNSGAPLAYQLV